MRESTELRAAELIESARIELLKQHGGMQNAAKAVLEKARPIIEGMRGLTSPECVAVSLNVFEALLEAYADEVDSGNSGKPS